MIIDQNVIVTKVLIKREEERNVEGSKERDANRI